MYNIAAIAINIGTTTNEHYNLPITVSIRTPQRLHFHTQLLASTSTLTNIRKQETQVPAGCIDMSCRTIIENVLSWRNAEVKYILTETWKRVVILLFCLEIWSSLMASFIYLYECRPFLFMCTLYHHSWYQ